MKRLVAATLAIALGGAWCARSVRAQERAVETFTYVVQAGDTCPSIAQHVYGDRRRYDVVHAYNDDLGAIPHRLTAGRRLTLPVIASRSGGADAELTSLRPRVRGRSADDRDWRGLRLGSDLHRGWRVNTLERAFAELTFRDTTQVTLRENTLVVVYGNSAERVRTSASEARLDRGSLAARLAEVRGRRMRVTTPSARADLEAGSAVVSVDESATSRVSNHDGAPARVSRPDGSGAVSVAPGMGSEVAQGQRPSRPRPLPAAPAWSDNLPTRWIGVAQRTTVRGSWEPVEGARVYRVEISRGQRGAGVVAAVEVPAEVTQFEVHQLPPGEYYARISTIARNAFESRPSARYRFSVELATLTEPGLAPRERFDPGDPSEEVRTLAVHVGTRFEAPESVSCALDGEPSRTLELDAEQEGLLSCTDAEGAALGGIRLAVVNPSVGTEEVRMTRGEPRRVQIPISSRAELPEQLTVAADGIDVNEAWFDGRSVTVVLGSSEQTPSSGVLRVVSTVEAEHTFATVPFAVVDEYVEPPPGEEGPVAPVPPPPYVHESFANILMASHLGVRDLTRRGVSAHATLGFIASPDDRVGDRMRLGLSAVGDVFDDHLRLGLGAALRLLRRIDAHRATRLGRSLRVGGLPAALRSARLDGRAVRVLPHAARAVGDRRDAPVPVRRAPRAAARRSFDPADAPGCHVRRLGFGQRRVAERVRRRRAHHRPVVTRRRARDLARSRRRTALVHAVDRGGQHDRPRLALARGRRAFWAG